MTTPSIVEFLTARLQEDEDTAQAGGGDEWEYEYGSSWIVSNPEGPVVYDEGSPTENQAVHIARVLREVEAKRKIVEAASITLDIYTGFSPFMDFITETLRRLASTWADHPDYDPAWTPFGESYREEWKP